MNPFVQYENIVPLLAPQDIVDTDTATPFVDLKTANKAAFLVFLGALTTATATDVLNITVEAATAAASGSEAQVAFNYRLSGAVGANTWGAITAATATGGVEIANTDDNKALWIEIDPAAILAAKADARFVRVFISPTDLAATLVAAMALVDPVYKQTTMISAT
jgi:hypothetical protein